MISLKLFQNSLIHFKLHSFFHSNFTERFHILYSLVLYQNHINPIDNVNHMKKLQVDCFENSLSHAKNTNTFPPPLKNPQP